MHSARRVRCVDVICVVRRTVGVPHSRSGPSLFVHGPDLIVDTPEDIIASLARSSVEHIAAGTYPTGIRTIYYGYRMWESLNGDYKGWPPTHRKTPLYFPWRVAEDVRDRLGIWETFTFLKQRGLIEIISSLKRRLFSRTNIKLRLFLCRRICFCPNCGRAWEAAFVAVDEPFGWCPSEEPGHFDLLCCLWV